MRGVPALNRQGFFNHLTTLMVGAALAQAVNFAAIPVISRLFTPQHFGTAAFFLSWVSILGAVGALRYEQAIVLPRDESRAAGAARLSVLILGVSVAILGLCILTVNAVGVADLALGAMRDQVFLLPLAVLLAGLVALGASWRIRRKNFRTVATAGVVGALASGGTRIASGAALGSSAVALIAGALVGYAGQVVVLWRRSGLRSAIRFDPEAQLGTAEIAREYHQFPMHATPTTLINHISQALPVVALAYLFPPAVVGVYALAERALRAPINVLAESARRVFYQRGSELYNAGRSLRSSFAKVTLGLVAIGAGTALVIAYWGEALFSFVFGAEWTAAGRFAATMIPWLLTALAMPPANVVFTVYRQQGVWLLLQVGLTVGRIAALGISAWQRWDPFLTIAAYVWVSAVGNLCIVLVALGVTRRSDAAKTSHESVKV